MDGALNLENQKVVESLRVHVKELYFPPVENGGESGELEKGHELGNH